VAAFANSGTAYATVVVGPDQFRRSDGRTAVAWGPEEHSDVCVTTVSTLFSTGDRLVLVYTPLGGTGCSSAGTWHELRTSPKIVGSDRHGAVSCLLPHSRRRQPTSLLSVDNKAQEAPVSRSVHAESTAILPIEPLRSAWMVLSTRRPSEKALRLLAPK